MAAQASAPSFLQEFLGGIKNRLYQVGTGKAAPGTLEREANDLLTRNYIDALKRQKTLTPQEERQEQLNFAREWSKIQQETGLSGTQALLPALLKADRTRTETQTQAYVDRLNPLTDSQSRLQAERSEQERKNLVTNYETYGNAVMGPAFELQRGMETGNRELRGQIGNRLLDIYENASNSDIAYRNQLLDLERQQNSGLRGFLNNLAPIAGLGLAAAELFRG